MGVYGLFPSGPGGYNQNTSANEGEVRDPGSILGWEDSCLENPMDRGARQAAVYRVAKSWIGLKQLNTLMLRF